MKMRMILTAAMLMMLTACDQNVARDYRKERESRGYQSAMADYNAGRIEQAIDGFKAVCRADPANSSARFQLACLLQENQKDMMGAVCAFAEFLNQQPASDRAKVARERMAICEKQLAKDLAEKHALSVNAAAYARETENVRKELKTAEAKNAKLQDDVAQAMRRVVALNAENERLKAALKEDKEGDVTVARRDLKDARAILDDDENESGDRIKQSADIASLRAEEKIEKAIATKLLAVQPPDAKAKRDSERAAEEERKRAEAQAIENARIKHPDFYVVQSGDTLYNIAKRFYGTKEAWRKIRDANKVLISIDGRVKRGDKLRLPE